MGSNVANAEVPEDRAEVRGVLRALELFREAPVVVIADKDAEVIAVQGHGQAHARGELAEQREIAVQVLGRAEVHGHDGARGVVDGAEQEERGAGAEPVELAAVDEDEAPHRRAARAPGPVLGGPAAPLGGLAEGPAQPADGAPANAQALHVAELLGAVAVIEVAVRGLDQLDDPLPDLHVQASARRLASAPVDQTPDPLRPIPGLEASELPQAHLQDSGPPRRS